MTRAAEVAWRARYKACLKSDAWRDCAARKGLRLSGGRCRLCARGAPHVRIEVHHRTYERLGCERPEDLCTLCSLCHNLVTAAMRQRRREEDHVRDGGREPKGRVRVR